MVVLQATLQVSETELRVPLDYSAVFAITLRHAGDSANSLAFKVKTTHAQRYFVRPNKGVLSPSSSVTLRVILQVGERVKLRNIHELLGQHAIDLDKAALLIQNCTIDSDAGLNEINDYAWRSNPTNGYQRININHFLTYNGGIDARSRPIAPNLPPFPSTAVVSSCLKEIDNDGNVECWKKAILLFIIVGNSLGFFPLLLGLNSLLKIIIDKGEWSNELQSFDQNSVSIEGRVQKREKTTGDIACEEKHFVRYTYQGTNVDGVVRTYAMNFSSDITVHDAKTLYEMTEDSPVVPLKILPNYPTSAIPTFLLEEKLKSTLYWARCLHPLRACLGIMVYLGLGLLWLISFPGYAVMSCAVAGIFIMLPLSLNRVRKELELKRRLLRVEPTSVPTEKDSYQWFLMKIGTSPSRRIKLMMVIVGAVACSVMSPLFFILLFAFGFFPIMGLSTSARWRNNVEDFQKRASSMKGKIHSRRSNTSEGTTSYYARIRYARVCGDNIYILERELLSEKLFKNIGQSLEVLVHPSHPLSGYPRAFFMDMVGKESCHSKFTKPLSILMGFVSYFIGHLIVYGNDIGCWIAASIAPILVMPQILVWAEEEHCQSKIRLYSGAKVVGFRKGRDMHADRNQQLAKAIQIDSDSTIAKAIPTSLEDESNQTLATELTDCDTTIASSIDENEEYFGCLENDDASQSGEIVHLQLV